MYLRNTLSDCSSTGNENAGVCSFRVILQSQDPEREFHRLCCLDPGAQAGLCGKTNPSFAKTTLSRLSEIETHLGDQGSFAFAFCVRVSVAMINTKYLFEKQQPANY